GELEPGTIVSEWPLVSGELLTTIHNQAAYEMMSLKVPLDDGGIYLVIGSVIGNKYASKIAGLTGLQVSFATDNKTGRLFLGSSLDPSDRALMIRSTEEMRFGGDYTKALDQVRERFVSTRSLFATKKGHVFLLMHQPLDVAMAPYEQLQRFVTHLLLTTLIIVMTIIWIFSTVLTRPLHQLSDAVKRLTVGDYTKKIEVRTKDEIGALAEVFNAMQDGIEQREQNIVQQSLTDPITGLPNRQHAITLLNEHIGHGYQVAVLLLDLGRFQHLRSTLGHKVADEMLRLGTARMKRNLDGNASLARLEGDEFLLMMPVSGVDAAINEAETMYAMLESGISVRKARVSLEVHIGVSLYPKHGDSADTLLSHASLAKQEAISARVPLKVYQEGRGAQHARRLRILSDLRSGIDEDQFKLHMQPKVSMINGDLAGAEALARWQHPELGEIQPGEFIPLFEEAGSISKLTRWVLEESIRFCSIWQEEGINLPVSVNLSAQDLKIDNLADEIDKLLKDYGLTSKSLVLEITEEALVRNMESTVNVLNILRSRGFRISMDDFGTGYSSLHQLKHLPIDELKIDREFIRDLPDDKSDVAIVKATIQLATTMGIDVVAEGVESEEAWLFLVREGCKQAQGYLVSKPIEASSFASWKRHYVRARFSPLAKGVQRIAAVPNK
ncbi:MAG: EAL domain-containing protein, partial [Gammaproteobacteria bacterium]|nr:EAL domain-containing protein [Gammaproteobacteria bacterium]